jgi:hypothetical protein
VATCVDARTGKEHWRQRLGGNFSASPIYAEGRIYFLSEQCEAAVLAPGKEFRQLANSQLEGRCLACVYHAVFIAAQRYAPLPHRQALDCSYRSPNSM